MWFTPLLVIFVSDKIEKIILFFIFQVLTFIEFPLLFGKYYTNIEYINSIWSFDWWITLIFFTIEYVVLFILLYKCFGSRGNF